MQLVKEIPKKTGWIQSSLLSNGRKKTSFGVNLSSGYKVIRPYWILNLTSELRSSNPSMFPSVVIIKRTVPDRVRSASVG